MSSIIKVDTIQTAAGAVPTANSLGLNTTGSVLGVAQSIVASKLNINNSSAKWGEVSLVAAGTGSKFLVEVIIGVGKFYHAGNLDRDLALGCGWKAGSVSSSAGDYSPLGRAFSRQWVAGLSNGTWYAEDAMQNPSSSGHIRYEVRNFQFKRLFDTTVAAGTTVNVSQWVSSDGSYNFGGSDGPGYSDTGLEQSITLTEIAG
jgi:hypothetical protein